ncbi:MAG: DMT family transporter [Spirochaetes bacterium]|nr:DMT family transporter [Spirochaetota bacterium]
MNKLTTDGKQALSSTGSWILLGLLSHSAWGGYPVLARYLQNGHYIGTMSLATMTNSLAAGAALVLLGPRIRIKGIPFKEVLILAFIVVTRGLTNLYTSKYTYATTVQLFSLLAPFVVAALSTWLYKEPLPRHTITALLLSLAGSAAMIYRAQPAAMIYGAGPAGGSTGAASAAAAGRNALGVGLAAISGLLLAFYMLFIKKEGKKGRSAETLAFIQFTSLAVCMGTGSLAAGESWKPWLSLAPSGIAAYLVFAFGVLLIGTVLQNNAIRNLGAPTYSTLQAMRLLSTIVYSWLLLGEVIKTFWQAAGTLTVIATISWYTLSQWQRTRVAASGG